VQDGASDSEEDRNHQRRDDVDTWANAKYNSLKGKGENEVWGIVRDSQEEVPAANSVKDGA